jgi:hypothetical protein
MISVMSLDEPYGDVGAVRSSSPTGMRAALEEKMKSRTPCLTAVSISAREFAVLLR